MSKKAAVDVSYEVRRLLREPGSEMLCGILELPGRRVFVVTHDRISGLAALAHLSNFVASDTKLPEEIRKDARALWDSLRGDHQIDVTVVERGGPQS